MDPTQDKKDQDAILPVPPSAGIPAKEAEPPLINASERGPEISAELKEIGKEFSQTPQLTQEDTQVGVRVSQRPAEPVTTIAPVSLQSPLTQAEIVAAKKSRLTDAIAWLAGTILRQIKRSRFNQNQSSPKSI